MSNEYKEWEKDRAEEAWDTLNKIIEEVEKDKDEIQYPGYFLDKYFNIKTILYENGWL